MKAIVLESFGGVENFRWRDWPMPEPKSGEVRIRVRAISVNPVDYKMRKGLIPSELPVVLGRDVVGTVDAVGENVSDFKTGDEVFAVLIGPRSNGAYAQYVTTPVDFVCPKPNNLSAEQAATLGVAGMTAYEAVIKKADVKSGERILVTGGAGGVGSFAIPLIRHCDAGIILATTSGGGSAEHLNQKLGVPSEHLIHYPNQSLERLEEQVQELTEGQGVSVAFDFVGGQMKKLCFNAVGFDGRVVSIVEEPPDFEFNIWRADTSPMFARSTSFHFVALSARARNGGRKDWSVYGESMRALTRLIENGTIPVPEVMELGDLSEESIRRAHTLLEAGRVKGKVVLKCR
ncbi:MAG: NADP-dependent oxidoreductase [Deltaproteobacteria bacterium]|nr:NADP-dependent oxidoreductase [Deltaproteobacteria bacterium]